VQNLDATTAVQSTLTQVYANSRQLPTSDVELVPGSVYYAYDPSTMDYWALAQFEPAAGDTLNQQVGFQDGGGTGLYKMQSGGAWSMGIAGEPAICEEIKYYPASVLAAWNISTSAVPQACS
jgi:hypothetical protein